MPLKVERCFFFSLTRQVTLLFTKWPIHIRTGFTSTRLVSKLKISTNSFWMNKDWKEISPKENSLIKVNTRKSKADFKKVTRFFWHPFVQHKRLLKSGLKNKGSWQFPVNCGKMEMQRVGGCLLPSNAKDLKVTALPMNLRCVYKKGIPHSRGFCSPSANIFNILYAWLKWSDGTEMEKIVYRWTCYLGGGRGRFCSWNPCGCWIPHKTKSYGFWDHRAPNMTRALPKSCPELFWGPSKLHAKKALPGKLKVPL